jgi:hypothetical protein
MYILKAFFVVIAFELFFSCPTFSFEAGNKISIGLQTVIWSHMWNDGKDLKDTTFINKRRKKLWQFAEYNLKKIKKIGGQWNIVSLDQIKWSEYSIESRKRKIEKIVEKHRNFGLDCVLRIKLDPFVYDLIGFNDKKYSTVNARGFLETFLKEISAFYDEGVKAILIGNEVDGQIIVEGKRYQIDHSAYRAVLNLSYNIIKSTDSRILVGDHGAASHLLAHAYIYDLLKNNRTEDAYTFWKNFMTVPGKESRFSMTRFKQSINRNGIKTRAHFVLDSLADPGSADFFQLHHYRSWKTITPLIQWVREKLNQTNSIRPIYACEIGYLMPLKKSLHKESPVAQDMESFSEKDQALELIKTIVTFLGNGINNVLYWQIRWNTNNGWAGRLYRSTENPEEFKALMAAGSFSLLAQSLNGLKFSPEKRFQSDGILEYSFTGTGKNKVSILWSQNGDEIIPLTQLREELISAINLLDKKRIPSDQPFIRVASTPIMITLK